MPPSLRSLTPDFCYVMVSLGSVDLCGCIMLWKGAGTQQEEAALEHSFFPEEASLTLLSVCVAPWAVVKPVPARLLEGGLSPVPGCFLAWV